MLSNCHKFHFWALHLKKTPIAICRVKFCKNRFRNGQDLTSQTLHFQVFEKAPYRLRRSCVNIFNENVVLWVVVLPGFWTVLCPRSSYCSNLAWHSEAFPTLTIDIFCFAFLWFARYRWSWQIAYWYHHVFLLIIQFRP